MSPATIAGVAAGTVVFGAGLVVFGFRRTAIQRTPTRLVLGLSLLLLGYHIAMWSLPAGMRSVSIPPDRWWMLMLGLAAALGGTALAESLEQRDQAPGEPAQRSDAGPAGGPSDRADAG